MTTGILLRTARRGSGLSQRGLATLAGDYQPTISALENGDHDAGVDHLTRLLAATGHRLVALPTSSRPVSEAANDVELALTRGDQDAAFRECIQLSDDLVHEHGAIRVALTAAPPQLVGEPRYDALIAGIAEHHLRAERLPLPKWITAGDRRLAEPWFVDDLPEAREAVLATTPASFSRRGVFLAATELASV